MTLEDQWFKNAERQNKEISDAEAKFFAKLKQRKCCQPKAVAIIRLNRDRKYLRSRLVRLQADLIRSGWRLKIDFTDDGLVRFNLVSE